MSSVDAARGTVPRGRTPRVLCAGIIVLDEVFRVEEFPAPDAQGRSEGIFCRQRRLRGECGGSDRAARRPCGAGRTYGRTGRRGRQRRPRAASFCPRKARHHALPAHRRLRHCFVGDLRRRQGRPDDRDLSGRAYRHGGADRSRRDRRRCRRGAGRQPVSAFRSARLRGRPAAQDPSCSRWRQGDGRGRSAVSYLLARGVFRRMSARDDRCHRSGARTKARSRATATLSSPSAMGRATSSSWNEACCAPCRFSRFGRWIHLAPAMRCTAVLCWRWRKGRTRTKRFASARRSPASNAAGSAARPAPRRVKRSMHSWPNVGQRQPCRKPDA